VRYQRSIRRFVATVVVAGLASVALVAASAPGGAAGPLGYVTVRGDGCQLATVDASTGHVAVLPAAASSEACVDDLAVAPDGSVYGLIDFPDQNGTNATLVHFDQTSGAVTSTVPFSGSFTNSFTAHGGIAFDAAGTMYATFVTNEAGCSTFGNQGDPGPIVCLYRIDPATAAATLVGPAGSADDFALVRMFWLAAPCSGSMATADQRGIDLSTDATAADPDAAFQEDVSAQDLGLGVAFVDPGTGAVTPAGAFPFGFDAVGLDYSRPDGTLYVLGRQAVIENGAGAQAPLGVSIYTVDPATGTLTLVVALDEPRFDVENLALIGTCPVAIELQPDFTG
jgi:hypothetical protein